MASQGLTKVDRRADIQGLRAIAVGMVVAFHAGLPLPGGFTGVDVFFVISGYVITGMLMREQGVRGNLNLPRFFKRRVQRLSPALGLFVSVVVLVSLIASSPIGPQRDTAATGLGAMLLSANIVVGYTTAKFGGYFGVGAEANPLLNTWSLSVEEQFYLIFPFLLYIAWKLRKGVKSQLTVLFLIALISVISFFFAIREDFIELPLQLPTAAYGFYSPLTRVWEFGVGACLALTLPFLKTSIPRVLIWIISIIGLGGLVYSLIFITGSENYPNLATVIPVGAAALLIVSGTQGQSTVNRWLGKRLFVRVGDLSYSLYLWHWPFIVFGLLLFPSFPGIGVVAAGLALIPTVLSYKYLEQPIRSITISSNRSFLKLLVICTVPAIAICVIALFIGKQNYWSNNVEHFVSSVSPTHEARNRGCHPAPAEVTTDASVCTWNGEAPGKPVYLVGDSNAEQFSEGFIAAAAMTDRALRINTIDACLFGIWSMRTVKKENPYLLPCASYNQNVMNWLSTQPKGDVYIGFSGWSFLDNNISFGSSLNSTSSDQKLNLGISGFEDAIERLKGSGHEVHLIREIPHFSTAPNIWDPLRCSVVTVKNMNCHEAMQELQFQKNQRAGILLVNRVAKNTNSKILDMTEFFCVDHVCVTQKGNSYLYRDAQHITVDASFSLKNRIAKSLSG